MYILIRKSEYNAYQTQMDACTSEKKQFDIDGSKCFHCKIDDATLFAVVQSSLNADKYTMTGDGVLLPPEIVEG